MLMPFRPLKLSHLGYWLLFLMLVMAGWLDLATPLLTVLFSYFALSKLQFVRNKWLAVFLFCIGVLTIFYVFAFMLRQAYVAFPDILRKSIPSIIEFAKERDFELPFDDLHSLRDQAIGIVTNQLGYLGNFAKIATKEFAFLLIGLIVAISLFLNPAIDLDRNKHPVRNNLYSFGCDEIVRRFRSFYDSFQRVMGAQLIISTLNTGFTAVFLMFIDLPYMGLVLALTFLCGLLPIVGNLISNSVIVAVSFTKSPQLALASLIYLIVLHKLEYFLNSKIIGERIKNPVWLTLLGLIIGERLMGIPGMILAPVVLNFIKIEASSIDLGRRLRPVPTPELEREVA
jgi:predicted PurR-regulated permease PerM